MYGSDAGTYFVSCLIFSPPVSLIALTRDNRYRSITSYHTAKLDASFAIPMRHRNGLIPGAGKRLAKRSIIGTRVCAPSGDDGKLCAGIIAAVKTAADGSETGYSIRFDDGTGSRREYRATELVGPGFQTLSDLRLMAGQRVYITFNGREICGDVVVHRPDTEEVRVSIMPHGHEVSVE